MPAETELYTRIKLLGEGAYGKAYLVEVYYLYSREKKIKNIMLSNKWIFLA